MTDFAPDFDAVIERLVAIQPMAYVHTRAHLDGALTRLSPYLTHGFLSLPDLARELFHRHRIGVQHKLINELGWREFFQHIQEHGGEEALFTPTHAGPIEEDGYSDVIPEDVRFACTQVPAIDQAVRTLYLTGHLHHQARLWLASYLVHLRKVHWRVGAHWLYSHLLDGDLASNALNWQLVAGVRGDKPYLFNADQVARYAPAEWHSAGTTIDNQEHFIELVAHSRATLAQVQRSEFGWEEPAVHTTAPASAGCTAPDPDLVRGKSVWWVHPWHLAELPAQLPPEMVVVAALWAEPLAAHPWDERRWAFVTQRMRALTPHVWFGSEAELVGAFAQAREVHTVSHLRVPDWTEVRWWKQPLPRLFRRLDAPVATFPQWWLQVNRQVRYLHQLVSLGKPRAA